MFHGRSVACNKTVSGCPSVMTELISGGSIGSKSYTKNISPPTAGQPLALLSLFT